MNSKFNSFEIQKEIDICKKILEKSSKCPRHEWNWEDYQADCKSFVKNNDLELSKECIRCGHETHLIAPIWSLIEFFVYNDQKIFDDPPFIILNFPEYIETLQEDLDSLPMRDNFFTHS